MGRNKSAADTLLRQWHMLRTFPRHPRRISVREIRVSLDVAGFELAAWKLPEAAVTLVGGALTYQIFVIPPDYGGEHAD